MYQDVRRSTRKISSRDFLSRLLVECFSGKEEDFFFWDSCARCEGRGRHTPFVTIVQEKSYHRTCSVCMSVCMCARHSLSSAARFLGILLVDNSLLPSEFSVFRVACVRQVPSSLMLAARILCYSLFPPDSLNGLSDAHSSLKPANVRVDMRSTPQSRCSSIHL